MPFPSRSPRLAHAAALQPPRRSARVRPRLETLEAILLLSGVPNDFSGNGTADYVVFDKTTATFEVTYPNQPGVVESVRLGNPAHDLVPVSGDFNGDGRADFAVYDKTVGAFFVKFSSDPSVLGESCYIGNPSHEASIIPVPGDYNGDGRTDFAIYDQTVATYFVKDSANPSGGLLASCQIGDASHGSSLIPVPGIYQGTNKLDFAIYDKTDATYYVKYATNPSVLGASCAIGDPTHAASITPVPGDYNGDGRLDFAIYDASVATYYVKYDNAPDQLGEWSQIGDPSHASSIVPRPGDYDGDGKADFGIYDAADATFFVKYATNPNAVYADAVPDGDPAHANYIIPITGDFDGDGRLDFTIFDQTTGTYYTKYFTNPTAMAVAMPIANSVHSNEPATQSVF